MSLLLGPRLPNPTTLPAALFAPLGDSFQHRLMLYRTCKVLLKTPGQGSVSGAKSSFPVLRQLVTQCVFPLLCRHPRWLPRAVVSAKSEEGDSAAPTPP